jgi:TP901 family phage tail tape measure protein
LTPNDQASMTAMNRARFRYNAFMDNLHQTSQRYQSAIMGSVAISMTGVGIQNYARPILEGWEKMTKAAMDYQQSLVKIQLTTADFGGLKGPALANANKQISNSIMAAGIASPLSNTQMADMTQTLATMGYHKSKQLNSLIAPSMLLQAISQKSDGSFELDQNSAAQLVSSLVLQSGKGLGKYTKTSLAGQKFSGVSENAMTIVSQMTKAAHDAHLTYADIKSYVGSGGATMGMSHMSLADFLTFGGALKKTGINPRQAGQDVKGLVQSASKFEAQNAMKPPKANSLGWWAEKLGFTSSNLSHNGDYLNNLIGVIDKAKKSGNLDKLMYLANGTGRATINAIMDLQNQHAKGVSGVDMDAKMMAKDIGGAGSKDYAKARLDALSKTPQYQWSQFLGTVESIGQTIGLTVLPGLNKFLGVMNKLAQKILQFTEAHPKLSAMLGWGMGLTGLLGMAGGKLITFAGEFSAAIWSIKNFGLQMLLSRTRVEMFSQGMVTGEEIMSGSGGGFVGSLKKVVLGLGALGIAVGIAYTIWHYNLGGIQDRIKEFVGNAEKAWKNATGAINAYTDGNVSAFNKQVAAINKQGGNWAKFAHFLLDVALVFQGFVSSFNSNKLSVSQFTMLKKEGLLPLLDKLINAKEEAKSFFHGFKKGFKSFTETIDTTLKPLKKAWSWFLDFIGLGDEKSSKKNHKNKFGGAAQDFSGIGEKVGKIGGYLLAALITIRLYSKLINIALGGIGKGWRLGKGMFNIGRGVFRAIRHPIQTMKGGMGFVRRDLNNAIEENSGVLFRVLGKDSFEIYKKLRGDIASAIRDGVREGNGETIGTNSTNPLEESLTGGADEHEGRDTRTRWQRIRDRVRGGASNTRDFMRSRFTRQGRSDRRWGLITHGMEDGEEVRTLFNSHSALDRAEAMRRIDAHRGLNRSTMSEHELNSAGYHASYDRTTGRRRNWLRERRNQMILTHARELHGQGRLGTTQEELEGMFNSRGGTAAHHISRLRTRDFLQDAEGMTEHDLHQGAMLMQRESRREARAGRVRGFFANNRTGRGLARFGRGMRAVARPFGAIGRGMGRFAMGTGGRMMGAAGVGLGILTMMPGVAEASGFGDGVDKVGASFGLSKKGGAGSAFKGALAGAGIGMMFGPVGALVGAAIGGIAGAIGTDKIKKFGKALASTAKSAWKTVSSTAKSVWKTISTTGKNIWKSITGAAKATWNAISGAGKAVWNAISGAAKAVWNGIKAFASAVWNGIKTAAMFVWTVLKVVATAYWNGIKTVATAIWNGIKTVAQGVWNFITSYAKSEWNLITGIAKAVWNGIKTIASGVWQAIVDIATGKWNKLGGDLNKIWDGFKEAAQKAWNAVIGFIKNNPITKAIGNVASAVGNGIKKLVNGSHAGGLGRVPFDGYIAELHKDEMVLTARQATDYRNDLSEGFKAHAKAVAVSSNSGGGGDTHISFDKGAIVIQMANSSAAEIDKAADQLFRKFMKKVEDKNMKNHMPSRMRGQLT